MLDEGMMMDMSKIQRLLPCDENFTYNYLNWNKIPLEVQLEALLNAMGEDVLKIMRIDSTF